MKKFILSQLGARGHYAVARILEKNNFLEIFYNDICAVSGWPKYLNFFPRIMRNGSLNRLLGRVPVGVDKNKIITNPGFGLEYNRRRSKTFSGYFQDPELMMWAESTFGKFVTNQGFGNASDVFCFSSEALTIFKEAKKKNLRCVLEQTVAPRELLLELLTSEVCKHPGWQVPLNIQNVDKLFCERERQEWELADVIICGSNFVKNSIGLVGGPTDKCKVVPYGVDPNKIFYESRREFIDKKINVLTVGRVDLRKGSPYVNEVAGKLKHSFNFRMVGTVGINQSAATKMMESVELVGAVPRSEIFKHYDWADVFLLPSVCEGSAFVTYEAMAAGLPVICTPNTGSVITDGVDGFIVNNGSVEEIICSLEKLQNVELRKYMSNQSRLNSKKYTVDEYSKRLIRELI